MNYIKEINAFRSYLKTNPLEAITQALWYVIADYHNTSNWERWITIDNQRLMAELCISEKTLIKHRNKLIQAGLLEYKSQQRKKGSGKYKLLSFELGEVGKAKSAEQTAGKITADEKNEILSRIRGTTNLEDAKEADFVVEAAIENMDLKKQIFKELDEICKMETILASNTSSLSITEIASATNRPDKVIGMHFFNPVPVMKLVEIIKGIATSEETKVKVMEVSRDLGKEPVEVVESPGFVVNRILIPMINEAIGILADGIASAEDIDLAMKLGANHPIGPLALA
ncbi:MAG: 3-hydroxyacyl-CoA dehydrogenase NAD-binding domain-containing protein, partial [Tissierellales bacterium]